MSSKTFHISFSPFIQKCRNCPVKHILRDVGR
jgi:hypothetical protein